MRKKNLFLVLLALLIFSGIALAQSTSGLEGSITIGPVMGGPARQGVADSQPLAETEFVVKQGERVVTSFRTDKDGHFKVPLEPGHYSVTLKERRAIGHYGPFEVDVSKAEMKKVQWKCDSGMR